VPPIMLNEKEIELHHALEAGVLSPDRVHATLGHVAAGLQPGGSSDAEITIADLTGLGAQDAVVASRVVERALASGPGIQLEAVMR
jgi:ornithine cyclodeaminase